MLIAAATAWRADLESVLGTDARARVVAEEVVSE